MQQFPRLYETCTWFRLPQNNGKSCWLQITRFDWYNTKHHHYQFVYYCHRRFQTEDAPLKHRQGWLRRRIGMYAMSSPCNIIVHRISLLTYWALWRLKHERSLYRRSIKSIRREDSYTTICCVPQMLLALLPLSQLATITRPFQLIHPIYKHKLRTFNTFASYFHSISVQRSGLLVRRQQLHTRSSIKALPVPDGKFDILFFGGDEFSCRTLQKLEQAKG